MNVGVGWNRPHRPREWPGGWLEYLSPLWVSRSYEDGVRVDIGPGWLPGFAIDLGPIGLLARATHHNGSEATE